MNTLCPPFQKLDSVTSYRLDERTNAIIPLIHARPSSCSKLEVTCYERQLVLMAHFSPGVKDCSFIPILYW